MQGEQRLRHPDTVQRKANHERRVFDSLAVDFDVGMFLAKATNRSTTCRSLIDGQVSHGSRSPFGVNPASNSFAPVNYSIRCDVLRKLRENSPNDILFVRG
jgi:hypothetical protein